MGQINPVCYSIKIKGSGSPLPSALAQNGSVQCSLADLIVFHTRFARVQMAVQTAGQWRTMVEVGLVHEAWLGLRTTDVWLERDLSHQGDFLLPLMEAYSFIFLIASSGIN